MNGFSGKYVVHDRTVWCNIVNTNTIPTKNGAVQFLFPAADCRVSNGKIIHISQHARVKLALTIYLAWVICGELRWRDTIGYHIFIFYNIASIKYTNVGWG